MMNVLELHVETRSSAKSIANQQKISRLLLRGSLFILFYLFLAFLWRTAPHPVSLLLLEPSAKMCW